MPIFSDSKLSGMDSYLGPEMKSTGEGMGVDHRFEGALKKAMMTAGLLLERGGKVLLSIANRDKPDAVELIRALARNGCELHATPGTAKFIADMGLKAATIEKRIAKRDYTIIDLIERGNLTAVVNTVTGDRRTLQDGFLIRRTAVERKIPCFTSLETAMAACNASFGDAQDYTVARLEEYLEG